MMDHVSINQPEKGFQNEDQRAFVFMIKIPSHLIFKGVWFIYLFI